MKHVIDADNQKVLETFPESATELVKLKYEILNQWDDVSIDVNGDIILWKE